VRAAAARGLTHLVVTDHDRIDGALAAREAAPGGLTVIVGEEIRTSDGDLIAAYLERAVAPGMSAAETVAAVREQGGLVGIPHPFDRLRGSILLDARMSTLVLLVDWVEVHNARLVGGGNERAAGLARGHGLAGIAFDATFRTVITGGVGWGDTYTVPPAERAQIRVTSYTPPLANINASTPTLILRGQIKRLFNDPGGLACIATFIGTYVKDSNQ